MEQDSVIGNDGLTDELAEIEIENRRRRGVSVITFADPGKQNRFVRHTQAKLAELFIDHEIIVVQSDGPRLSPLAGCRNVRFRQSFRRAIEMANYPTVAVMDIDYPYDPGQYFLLRSQLTDYNFQSFSYPMPKMAGWRAVLPMIYWCVMRFLLRVRKNGIAPGCVMFRKSAVEGVNLKLIAHNDRESATYLLSLARMAGKRVVETVSTRQCDAKCWGVHARAASASVQTNNAPSSKVTRRFINRAAQFWFGKLMFPVPSRNAIRKQPRLSNRKRQLASVCLIAVAWMVMMTGLGYPLFEPDESRNAQLAINMIDTGNWLQPMLDGEPYMDKPPLMGWLTAISYQTFGVSEWATRLPAACCGMITLLAMLTIGRRIVGFRPAAIGVAMACLSLGFVQVNRFVTMDALLTSCVTVAVLASYLAWFNGRFRKHWAVIAGLALGLGLLAKGPIAIVLIAVPVLLYSYFQDAKIIKQRRNLRYLAIPMLVIACPWFLYASISNPSFLHYFLWKHHVVRFSESFIHREPFWYYGPVLLMMLFPATMLLPLLFRFLGSRKPEARAVRSGGHGFLLIYALWVIGFFSLSESKLPTYIVPALVPLCLLLGSAFEDRVLKPLSSSSSMSKQECTLRYARTAGLTLAAMILIPGLIILVGVPSLRASLFVSALAVFVAVGCVAIVMRKSKPARAWSAVGVLGLLFVSLFTANIVPAFSQLRSVQRALAAVDGERSSQDLPVVFFGRNPHAVGMQLNAERIRYFRETELVGASQFVAAHPDSLVVTSGEHLDRIREMLESRLEIEPVPGTRHIYEPSPSMSRVAAGQRKDEQQSR